MFFFSVVLKSSFQAKLDRELLELSPRAERASADQFMINRIITANLELKSSGDFISEKD